MGWDGPITLVFTDIVGSTSALQSLGDDEGEQRRRRLFDEFRADASSTHGEVVKNLGDGLMLAFARPADALRCAAAMQRRATLADVGLRVGAHVGEVTRDGADYFGTPVVIASRLCDNARSGQVLVSEVVRELVGTKGGFGFERADDLQLKGIDRPVAVSTLQWELTGLSIETPQSQLDSPKPAVWSGRGRVTLAGRSAELSLLEAEFARACLGELRVVAVVGDPGLGKTRLGAELVSRIGSAVPPPAIVSARAHPLGASSSLALWVEGFDAHLRSRSPAAVERLCGAAVDDLSALLRSVATARPPRSATEPSYDRLVGGLVELMANLSSEGPLVVALDDVHLADPLSWDLLARVARQLAQRPLLVIATARPAELAEHAVAPDVLTVLNHDGVLTRIDLMPLTATEVGALGGAMLDVPPPPALLQWLVERSRGNPMFAIELLRGLVDAGADLSEPELTVLPEGVAGMVAGRLRGLAERDRAALEFMAVVGRRVEVAELIRLSGMPLEQLGVVLERLVRARLVVEEDRGPRLLYEVAHPLVQDAIYGAIGGARRRVLHRRVARSLLASGQRSAAAAHYVRSASAGDREAIDALIDALGQAEDRSLHREAMTILANLADILDPGDAAWVSVLDALDPDADWVVSHLAEDDVDPAVEALLRIEGVLGADGESEGERMAVVQLRLGTFVGFSNGQVEEGIRRCRRAALLFERAGSTERSLLADNEAAYLLGCGGDLPAQEAGARGVLARAEELGDDRVILHALANLSWSLAYTSRPDEAIAACERGETLARAKGDRYRTAWFAIVRAVTMASTGRLSEALPAADAAAADPAVRDSLTAEQGIAVHWNAGNLDDAIRYSLLVEGRNRRAVSRRQAFGLAYGARALIDAGRADEARDVVARTLDAYEGREFHRWSSDARVTSAVLRWHDGDTAVALDELERGVRRLVEIGAHIAAAAAALDLSEVAAEVGDVPRADLAVAVTADLTGVPIGPAVAGMARAAQFVAAGEPGAGVPDALGAVEAFASLGYRLYHGRALLLLARASARVDRSGAVDAAEEAASVFAACGAGWHVQRAARVLKGLGSRGRRLASAVLGPESLTERERDVALLAADGRTAKEIATALFIGERTVETHLANAYAKLGIGSKRELASQADAIRTGYGGHED